MTISEKKRALRAEIKKRIPSIPAEQWKSAEQEICRKILELPEYQNADTIFCFVGREDEINTRPILADAWASGKRVCVPKCLRLGVMEAREIGSLDELIEVRLGLLEPGDESRCIPPGEIGFAVIPCASCNLSGHRLGFGGGFYDRYLRNAVFFRCLICRHELLTAGIPMEEHDVIPDMVITERETVRVSR